jgi:phenylalanyl-tRNA synthetase alpha chain
MKSQLQEIKAQALADLKKIENEEEFTELKIKYLARRGVLPQLLRTVSSLPKEQRPEIGKLGNQIRKELEAEFAARESQLKAGSSKAVKIDLTLPGKKLKKRGLHPVTQLILEIEEVFARLGFRAIEGPEIDDDWHNFEALNFPPDHPAREMQDTFFVADLPQYVLRTQTSNMQIREMEAGKPPFRIVAPGKTYRKDSDATHSPMFHQFECLYVDRAVSLGQLKWIMQTALSELLVSKIKLRFRLSYFPFTEPSVEVDATCVKCSGQDSGCRVCKGTGWLEIGGAGMVHPNVLENAGVDPKEWNGFAFGCGIERILMLRHGIDDLRLFYNNDLRFLEQF